ncbi:MAG TPA: class I SAM-dependent methyltransferase [Candidatus Xenobia bacterium]
MTQTVQQQPTSVVFDTFFGHQKTAALKAAIELDLFTAIAEGYDTAPRLAERCRAAERGVRILADGMTVIGLLTKKDQTYQLTQESAMLLDARSPAYMGKAADFLVSPDLMRAYDHMTEAVRRGGTTLNDGGTIAPEHPAWIAFATSMRAFAALPAQAAARHLSPLPGGARVLDIAASHGEYGMSILRSNPQARVVAVDWANVLKLTRQFVAEAGLADRWEALPGSAFDVDLGTGYDAALVPNFVHHFEPERIVAFYRRLHAALNPGGRVALLEFVPNEDRVSPPIPASFSMTMLATTAQGDAYTEKQHQAMLAEAGFNRVEVHPIPPTPQTLILASRP